jgi:hypothetical protein
VFQFLRFKRQIKFLSAGDDADNKKHPLAGGGPLGLSRFTKAHLEQAGNGKNHELHGEFSKKHVSSLSRAGLELRVTSRTVRSFISNMKNIGTA